MGERAPVCDGADCEAEKNLAVWMLQPVSAGKLHPEPRYVWLCPRCGAPLDSLYDIGQVSGRRRAVRPGQGVGLLAGLVRSEDEIRELEAGKV